MDNNNQNQNQGQPVQQPQESGYQQQPEYQQQQYQQQYQPANQDGKSVGIAILCFFFPIVGLILFLVWKDEKPLKAKSAGMGAIIGVVVQVILYIITIALGVLTSTMLY